MTGRWSNKAVTGRVESWIFFAIAFVIGLTFAMLPLGWHTFPGYQLWKSFHLAGLYVPFSFFLLGQYLLREGNTAVLPVRLCVGIVPFLFASITLKLLFGQPSPLINVINEAMSPFFSVPFFGCFTIASAMMVLNDRVVEGLMACFVKVFARLWDDGEGPKLEEGSDMLSEDGIASTTKTSDWNEQLPPWLAPPQEGESSPQVGGERAGSGTPTPPVQQQPSWVDPDPGLTIMGSPEEEPDRMPWQAESENDAGRPSAEEPRMIDTGAGAKEAAYSSVAMAREPSEVFSPEPAQVGREEDGAVREDGPGQAGPAAEEMAGTPKRWGQGNERLLAPLWGAALAYPRAKRRWVQYRVPTERLLGAASPLDSGTTHEEDARAVGDVLLETLLEFKIEAEVTGVSRGPSITQYEILPAPGVRLSRIETLADNIALRLAAPSVRIVAPIPGKKAVGIEIPNAQRQVVAFRDVMVDRASVQAGEKMVLPVVLGQGIDGRVHMLDLSQAPHLLVAGATGSGKSVCINTLIASLISCRPPTQMRLLMVDPKIVELKLYNDIPHLLAPVITDPKQALQSLKWCLGEMERRYWLLDHVGVRDIGGYNRRLKERGLTLPSMEYMVIIVDEFADLMALTGKEMESLVARMAAMSRAVGMHMVLATQRPSVDVITGLIKANFPTRIAFMVASKVDSRIILDTQGAEQLLGKGDMLFSSSARPGAERIQGAFLSEDEVERIVDYVRSQGEPHYVDELLMSDEGDEGEDAAGDGNDPLYEQAMQVARKHHQVSASMLQRRLQIGYSRAARIVDRMESEGVVGPQNGSKPRELLAR